MPCERLVAGDNGLAKMGLCMGNDGQRAQARARHKDRVAIIARANGLNRIKDAGGGDTGDGEIVRLVERGNCVDGNACRLEVGLHFTGNVRCVWGQQGDAGDIQRREGRFAGGDRVTDLRTGVDFADDVGDAVLSDHRGPRCAPIADGVKTELSRQKGCGLGQVALHLAQCFGRDFHRIGDTGVIAHDAVSLQECRHFMFDRLVGLQADQADPRNLAQTFVNLEIQFFNYGGVGRHFQNRFSIESCWYIPDISPWYIPTQMLLKTEIWEPNKYA